MSGTTDLAKVGSAGSDLVATSLSVGADGLEVSRTSDITSSPPVPTLTRTLNTRDAATRLTRATLSTGPSTTFLSQYLYDSAGRLQRQWGPDSGAGAGYLATAATTNAYTYHATTGQKTGESIKLQAVGTAGTITAAYTYTGAGRLSTATVNGVADSTVFDPAGNLTSFTGTTLTYQENRLATTVTGGATTYYFFDAAKRWRVSEGLLNNPSDPNRIRYTYTATGRLATFDNPAGAVSAAYTYDAAGQRTASSVTVSGQTTSTSFAYEGLRLLNLSATQSGGTNPTSWKISYLYDEQGRPYAGVYRQPGEGTTPLVFGILTADRGDVVSLLDAAGAPFAAYRYDAWGGNPQGTGNVQTGVWSKSTGLISLQVATDLARSQPLRYASYYYDSESGLYYLSSRSYDPATRQFLSKDLSRNDGEESAYQYCGGNPVAGVDPTGYRMEIGGSYQKKSHPSSFRRSVRRVGSGLKRAGSYVAPWSKKNPWFQNAYQGGLASKAVMYTNPVFQAINGYANEVDASRRGDPYLNCLLHGLDGAMGVANTGLLGYGAIASVARAGIGARVGAAATEGAPAVGEGFSSFSAAKRALGSPGAGNVYDHVVEQSQMAATRSGFDPRLIHNPYNLNPVPTAVNQAKANYYSSIRPFTGGETVRNWLNGQSFGQQYSFGMEATSLIQSGAALP